jgi:hypothetical protein
MLFYDVKIASAKSSVTGGGVLPDGTGVAIVIVTVSSGVYV